MSEFLVHPNDHSNADAEKDRIGCWKKGYFIEEREDGHWDQQPWSWVLKIPGKKIGECDSAKLLGRSMTTDVEPVKYRRRKWGLAPVEFDKIFQGKTRATMSIAEFQALMADPVKIVDIDPDKEISEEVLNGN